MRKSKDKNASIKSDEFTLDIIDLSDKGQGIGRVDGITVFVKGDVIPGDRVTAIPVKNKKRYIEAKLLWIDRRSPHRGERFCAYAEGEKSCGGCRLAPMNYDAQLAFKEKQVKDKLKRLGGVSEELVKNIIGMKEPFSYRNKCTMWVEDGTVGFRSAGTHKTVDCIQCKIQTEAAQAAAEALRSFLRGNPMTESIKSVTVRTSFSTGQVMVILNGETFSEDFIPEAEELIGLMDDNIYEAGYSLESVVWHDGNSYSVIAGKPTIDDSIGELKIEISPGAFYQVNSEMRTVLYDKVVEYAELKGGENILDLYCGGGSIGLYLVDDAQYAVGVESVRDAVVDANRNAVINGVINARFICGKAEEVLPELLTGENPAKGGGEKTVKNKRSQYDEILKNTARNADIVIIDPPRRGADKRLLEAAASVNPQKIIYVSCDPATLARDVKILRELGYALKEVTPVDMFPHTLEIESVTLLVRK